MKVIIQRIDGSDFLTIDGRWVTDKALAQDFYTLLRAYRFAQANTTVSFRVLLHCPEDDYSASIIEGVGKAGEQATFRDSEPEITRSRFEIEDIADILAGDIDATRLHLN
ncbi:MAG TPA: hypothetical protein VFB72_20445 [Verrucomicrobiae bacterium]|nr:hypothetical protein [Verrucomicrobiae bacterium]